MRRNVRTASYMERLDAVPASVRELAEAAFELFLTNPDAPGLRRQQLRDGPTPSHRPGSWSVRINRQYLAVYVVEGDTNVWYWVGTHGEFDSAFRA